MKNHVKIESLKAELRGEFDYSELLNTFISGIAVNDIKYNLIHEDTEKVSKNSCKCFEI